MDDRLKRTIERIDSWDELEQLKANIASKGELSAEISTAIATRSTQLGVDFIAEKTGIDLVSLSPAENEIVRVVGEYVAIMRNEGKYPGRTLEQIRNRGLIGAAEASVSKAKPTQGYKTLLEADLADLSYEQIVVDHPEEFSARAIWYARRTLGLENSTAKPPTEPSSITQDRTSLLLQWLQQQAAENDGFLPPFTNADAAHAMGMHEVQRFGQVHGNIQSRIDYACYVCDLPPLGCAAEVPFRRAWGQQKRVWAFPIEGMQAAAKSRQWGPTDFNRILKETEHLPGQAHLVWKEAIASEEGRVKAWAMQFGDAKVKRQPASDDSPEFALLPAEVLRQATPEYIWLAVQRFMEGNVEHSFSESTKFDLIADDGRRYPPKAVFGLALSLALGGRQIIPKNFVGGEDSLSVQLLREAGYQVVPKGEPVGPADPAAEDQEWAEGGSRLVTHIRTERAPGLSQAKKAEYRRLHGKLTCERCGLDPVDKYGTSQAESCIEVHHDETHVSAMTDGHRTRLNHLQCLCANCHRLVHRILRDELAADPQGD